MAKIKIKPTSSRFKKKTRIEGFTRKVRKLPKNAPLKQGVVKQKVTRDIFGRFHKKPKRKK